jgi:hypothetical protein
MQFLTTITELIKDERLEWDFTKEEVKGNV